LGKEGKLYKKTERHGGMKEKVGSCGTLNLGWLGEGGAEKGVVLVLNRYEMVKRKTNYRKGKGKGKTGRAVW